MASEECKRPYELGKRLETSDQNRAAVIQAGRKLLAANGFLQFTMAAVARESGLSRQTVHNLFGTKADLVETIFDDIAVRAGMQNMRAIMQQSDPAVVISEYVGQIVAFWSNERLLIRRIHGLAAIDPDFEVVLRGRSQRRRMAAGRILHLLERRRGMAFSPGDRSHNASVLYSLTSFEFFDVIAESTEPGEDVARVVLDVVNRALKP